MPLTAAIKRCRRAYAANHIPWDANIARLGRVKMDELSEYWERKAGITEDTEDDEPTLHECVEVIRAIQPVPPNGTQAGRIVNAQSHRFNGSYRE